MSHLPIHQSQCRSHKLEAILQRVHSASVSVDNKLVSQIGRGVLALVAVGKDDSRKEAESLSNKVLKMKLWDDDTGGRVGGRFVFSAMILTRHEVEKERSRH